MKIIAFLAASVALTVAALSPAHLVEAVTCADVNRSLGPCISYLQNEGNPTQDCCSGVSNLNGMTQSTGDRRAACKCIKQGGAGSYQNVKPDAARDLPGKCGVYIGVPIRSDIDCNTIS